MRKSAVFMAVGIVAALAAQEHKAVAVEPEQALETLLEGNKRYTSSHLKHPHESAEWRHSISRAQHPFATILSCSDSRVPPELIFDVGLGDLFVVRVAGNIASDDVVGSLEYAAEHLGTTLILVMGHQSCGAVQSTIAGGEPKTHIEHLTRAIEPAVTRARQKEGDLVANAVRENVNLVVEQLRTSHPILAELSAQGKLKVIGAVYDLDSGIVRVLP